MTGAKTLTDGAAHTYIAYIREYHPAPPGSGAQNGKTSNI